MSAAGGKLADWLARLESFSPHEIELGLERVLEVLERLGLVLPELVLHIAGTNGKGSSVAMAQALLTAAGLRTGAYTSPHIAAFNERIAIDGKPVDDEAIVKAFERVDDVRKHTPLTYFEFSTLAAMVVFESYELDAIVLEIGLGGRLDAVNAIEPAAGLITNVSLDHCEWLGDNIEAIAAEKAGIMRPGKPVVFADENAPAAILDKADRLGADLVLAGSDYSWQADAEVWHWRGRELSFEGLRFPGLPGQFQLRNAAGVLALLEVSGIASRLDQPAISEALAVTSLDGRLQRVERDRQWLLDVAHNPAAAQVLADVLSQSEFAGRTVAIIAMLDDKDVEGVVEPLIDHVDNWIAVTADSTRAIEAAELARRVANRSNQACLIAPSLDSAMTHARDVSSAGDRVLVTGSFYIVGPALDALGLYSRGLGNS